MLPKLHYLETSSVVASVKRGSSETEAHGVILMLPGFAAFNQPYVDFLRRNKSC